MEISIAVAVCVLLAAGLLVRVGLDERRRAFQAEIRGRRPRFIGRAS